MSQTSHRSYSFEPQHPDEIIEEALKGFNRLLSEGGFRVDVDVPSSLPQIRADRTALVLALDNLIDNAMRYSGEKRDLSICAHVIIVSIASRMSSLVMRRVEDAKAGFASMAG